MVFTKIEIARQLWTGTPQNPQFLNPIYRVECEVEVQRHSFELSAADSIDAQKIASARLGIPFVMH
jgi:hypothetical protein